jgi:hypothetical protein
MYLCLAIFWFVSGVLLQYCWTDVAPFLQIPGDRNREIMGVIFFVLFSYNFFRWRMERMLRRAKEEANKPPPKRPVVLGDYDPTFDISKSGPGEAKPNGNEKKDPPTVP